MVLHAQQTIARHNAISTFAQLKHWDFIPECCKQDDFFLSYKPYKQVLSSCKVNSRRLTNVLAVKNR